MKILLVDDEPVLRSSIAILLRRIDPGVEVCEMGDGEAALEMLEKKPYDVVISDIKMPRMDGITLTRVISERWTRVQIVLLTGYANFDYAREALRCGATDYLLKPIRYSEIQEMMARVKKRREQLIEEEARAENEKIPECAMQEACRYIRSHYAENLTLAKMGEKFFLNASYFSEQFSRAVGKSFVEYLTEVRMEHARAALAQPGKSVTDIAMDVGYSDSRYFGAVFKKLNGMTPSEYRRKLLDLDA